MLSNRFRKEEEQEERMEEEEQKTTRPAFPLITTLNSLLIQLHVELQTNQQLAFVFKFIPEHNTSREIQETLKGLKETIKTGKNILDRILQAQSNEENRLSPQEAFSMQSALHEDLLPNFKNYRSTLFSELQNMMKNSVLLSEDNCAVYMECLNEVHTKFNLLITQIKTNNNTTVEEKENFSQLLNNVFTELQKDLLPVYFSDQYKNTLTLIEEHRFLEMWQKILDEKMTSLPKRKGYQYAKDVKELLYNTKTDFRRSFYRQISREVNRANLTNLINQNHDDLSSPDGYIESLKAKVSTLQAEINKKESTLKNYSYVAGFTSTLTRLWTNTQYYTFGTLSYNTSKELIDTAAEKTQTGRNVADSIDRLEQSMKGTIPGRAIDYALHNLDSLLNQLDPKSVLAIILLGVDQCSVKWLGSANFMLAHSLTDTLTTDIEPLIRLCNRINISTQTAVNHVEPKARMLLNFGIYMGLAFGKQLFKSDEKTLKLFVAGTYILSMTLRSWIGKKIDQSIQALPEDQRSKTPYMLILVKFIIQFLSGLAIGFATNKLFQPLFFKPKPALPPEEASCLDKPEECKEKQLETLGLSGKEPLTWSEFKHAARKIIAAQHPDATHTDSADTFRKLAEAKKTLVLLHEHKPEIFPEETTVAQNSHRMEL